MFNHRLRRSCGDTVDCICVASTPPNIVIVYNGVKDIYPSNHAMPKNIGFLIYPSYLLLDLAGPMSAFALANRFSDERLYRMQVVSVGGGPISQQL
jgi:hypothetical protein